MGPRGSEDTLILDIVPKRYWRLLCPANHEWTWYWGTFSLAMIRATQGLMLQLFRVRACVIVFYKMVRVAYRGTWVTAHTAPSKYLIFLHPSNWEWQLAQQFWRFCPENNCGFWQFCPKKITECIPASVLLWNRDQLRLCLQCFQQKVEGQKWRWQKINIHKWEELEERFNLQHVFMTNLTTTMVKIELKIQEMRLDFILPTIITLFPWVSKNHG